MRIFNIKCLYNPFTVRTVTDEQENVKFDNMVYHHMLYSVNNPN
jgi:hypothetical protein